MGSASSTENQVIIPKDLYESKQQEYERLISTNESQKLEITRLQSRIHVLQQENSLKEKKLRACETELKEYKSLPIIKRILDVNPQITNLEKDITTFLNTNQPDINEQIIEEIHRLKANINNYRRNLPNNVLASLPDMSMDELRQLQDEIKFDEITDIANKENHNGNIKDALTKLNNMKQNVPVSLDESLNKIDNEMAAIRNLIADVPKTKVNPKYEEMKAILVRQENELLKAKLEFQMRPREYSLIFCNITEEFDDNKSDFEKILEVVQLFSGISYDGIKVSRLGIRNPDKPRVLKVIFPTMNPINIILRYKHQLKNSPYSHVRIYPNKFDNPI